MIVIGHNGIAKNIGKIKLGVLNVSYMAKPGGNLETNASYLDGSVAFSLNTRIANGKSEPDCIQIRGGV
jgi:prepilin-type processing-associated H-X9-DG protein